MSPVLPRLVVSDLDGTLLRPDGSLSRRTVEALTAIQDAGVTVVFATGRPIRWLDPLIEAARQHSRTRHDAAAPLRPLGGHVICSNGAVLYDLHADRIVEQRPLDIRIGNAVIAALAEAVPSAAFGVELGRTFRCEADYPYLGVDSEVVAIVERAELFGAEPVVKLLAKDRSYDSDVLLAKAREVAGDVAEFTHSGDGGLLEISTLGVSKASTLASFCAARGIESSEVVAFGDMPNDLAMLGWAGRSYAVANAHPLVRDQATRTCGPNTADGVAAVLEELLDAA